MSEAEAQWRAQFTAMKTALAELKLPGKHGAQETSYAAEFDLDEDFTSGNSGDDVWDFISDDDEDLYSSDFVEDTNGQLGGGDSGLAWFMQQCSAIAAKKNGLSPEAFQAQVLDILNSHQSEHELQSQLTDLVGFDGTISSYFVERFGFSQGMYSKYRP